MSSPPPPSSLPPRLPIPPRPDALHPPALPGPDGRPPSAEATWGIGEAVGVYLLAIVLASLVTLPIFGLISDEDLAAIVASAVAAVAIVGILVGWLSRRHPTWRAAMRFPGRGEWWPELRASVGFGLLLYPGMVFGVGLVLSLVLGAISGESVQAPEQVPSDPSAVGIAVTALYAVVIAPLHEEFYFRGVLFRGARDRHGLGVGLLATGLGFSVIHYIPGPWEDAALLMGVMFFNGIALGWWYERRGRIVAPIVAHMVFNVIGLTLIWTID
jgi:membrane protease YdiL (CAAX protease family)